MSKAAADAAAAAAAAANARTPAARPSVLDQWANIWADATTKYESKRVEYNKAEAAHTAGRIEDADKGLSSSNSTNTLLLKMNLAKEFLDKAQVAFSEASDSYSKAQAFAAREAKVPDGAADSGEKLSATHLAILESLKYSALMTTQPDPTISIFETLFELGPQERSKVLAQLANMLRTPLTGQERSDRSTPESRLTHGLGATPHISRVTRGDDITTASFQALMLPLLKSMQENLLRKKARRGVQIADGTGGLEDTMDDPGASSLTKRGTKAMLFCIQTPSGIRLDDKGSATTETVASCVREDQLTQAESQRLVAPGSGGVRISQRKVWSSTAAALQLSLTKQAHSTTGQTVMSGMTATDLYTRHLAMIVEAHSARFWKLHMVTLTVKDSPELHAMHNQAALLGYDFYRRDRIRQEEWVARRLLGTLQKLSRNGVDSQGLRRAFLLFWSYRMYYNVSVLCAGHVLYAAEHIQKGPIADLLDKVAKLEPLANPLDNGV